MTQIEHVHDRVLSLLEQYPSTRDDDLKLIFLYWQIYHKNTFQEDGPIYVIVKSHVGELTHPESIRRVRAKIQNEEGRFRGSDETEQRRVEEKIEWEKWVGSG